MSDMPPGPLQRWWRERRFLFAYRTLRNEEERHSAMGHRVEFTAVSPTLIGIRCLTCNPRITRNGGINDSV